jgi:iron complex transport system substrate-binding protein
MQARIKALVAEVPHTDKPLTYYYELSSNPYYTATASTFIGSVFGLLGLKNIAIQSKEGDYPEISSESIIAANPTLVFLADTGSDGDQTPATVAARPGWGVLAAVQDHRVIALDDDIASRWGPRIVTLLASVVGTVRKAAIASNS